MCILFKMRDIQFKPVLFGASPLVESLNFTTMYFGRHSGKNVVITCHQTKTLMIVLKNDEEWSVEFFTSIPEKNKKSFASCHKIKGNQNLILQLDESGMLWKLINTSGFSKTENDYLGLIDKNCSYEWAELKIFQHYKVLEMTTLDKRFAFIMEDKDQRKFIFICPSYNLSLTDIVSFEELNLSQTGNYRLTGLDFDGECTVVKKEPFNSKGALAITEMKHGSTYIWDTKKNISILAKNLCLQLVSVLNFYERRCLLLCYSSGKFLFVHLNEKFQFVRECSLNVYHKVVCIEKCDCSESCVIWSSGKSLHHTNIQFTFDESKFSFLSNLFSSQNNLFANLIHIPVSRNLMGVSSLLKLHSGLLALNFNRFYYHIFSLNPFSLPVPEYHKSEDEILSEIMKQSLLFDSLTKENQIAAEYLQFMELIQTDGFKDKFILKRDNEHLIIKTIAKQRFRKEHWKLRQEACQDYKYLVEMTELETDLHENIVIKVKSNFMSMDEIDLSLVGDFGEKFDVLILFLGKVAVDKNREKEIIAKNLVEIAKRKNPYFKNIEENQFPV